MTKPLLLNCLAVFVFFNVCVLLISCAKKKATEIRAADASPSKPAAGFSAKPGPAAHNKFTVARVMEAIGKMAEAQRKDLKVAEISGKAPGGALYEKRVFGRKRLGTDRSQCMDNLGKVYKAMLAFAQDNGERLPWQLTSSGVRNHLDASAANSDLFGAQADRSVNIVKHHSKAATPGGVFGMLAVKAELVTPTILISPCDPGRKAANEVIQTNWNSYNTKTGSLVPHNGLSYGLCFGADTQRPLSVLATTRNLSTDDLATARWLGFNLDRNNSRTMAGLTRSQGQMVTMDGAVKQPTDEDIGANGKVTKALKTQTGGVATGVSSPLMMLPY